jgi:DNA helicase IV
VYIGRIGLLDEDGRPLLVDWRTPAAAPFFAATHADPAGLLSRRRYQWARGRITDYWDEVFSADGLEDPNERAALDYQSSFITSLGSSRSGAMRDVLATIQGDQDAIIRADAGVPLVVNGGPGTGKTVVALHRAAYLMYSQPRLKDRRGGVLFVGPHRPYASYVANVLPSLGESEVAVCTLDDLVPGVLDGIDELPGESSARASALKSDLRMIDAVKRAISIYEEAPAKDLTMDTPLGKVHVSAGDWEDAFSSVEHNLPHNEARDQIWETLLDLLSEKSDTLGAPEKVRGALALNITLSKALNRAWPLLSASDLVSDLWEVPALLRLCAPWLNPEDRAVLRRPEGTGSEWTTDDLPLLDAARHLLGDETSSRRLRVREAERAAEREYRAEVAEALMASNYNGSGLMSQLQQSDLQEALVDDPARWVHESPVLDGPFAHVIVDEAQELTDMQWQMLLRRCPSRHFTIVGDRAQARGGFAESWEERLTRVGVSIPGSGVVHSATLSVNYRTPSEVMDVAAPVVLSVLPDADVPTSVRSTGQPVERRSVRDLAEVLVQWEASHTEGVACVIASEAWLRDSAQVGGGVSRGTDRISWLTPSLAKGLEFDLVVLVQPSAFGSGVEAAVDTYVAMTRATQRLVILE